METWTLLTASSTAVLALIGLEKQSSREPATFSNYLPLHLALAPLLRLALDSPAALWLHNRSGVS